MKESMVSQQTSDSSVTMQQRRLAPPLNLYCCCIGKGCSRVCCRCSQVNTYVKLALRNKRV